MAYVPQQQSDEEKRRLEAGGGELGSFGSTQGSAAPTAPKFVNVADYLTKNPEGSAQIGDKVAANLQTKGTEAQAAVTDAGSKFNQDVESGGVKLDQGLVDNALSDPTNFVKDPNNVAKFSALRDASYKGPTSLQNTDSFAPTQEKVSKLSPLATSIGTEEGRNSLVQDLSVNPTHGKTALNQLLLQGNPANADKINGVVGGFKNTEDAWAQLLQNAPDVAAQARATTDAARTTVQGGLNTAKDAFGNDINAAVAGANTNRDAYNKYVVDLGGAKSRASGVGNDLLRLQQELSSNPALKGTLYNNAGNPGTGAEWLSRVQGLLNPSSWLGANVDPITGMNASPDGTVPTAETIATPEQYAREQALEQLSGGSLDYLQNDRVGEAGTYKAPTPGAIPTLKDPSGQKQYMNDLLSFYTNPSTTSTRPSGVNVKDEAQKFLSSNTPGNGVNISPDQLAALQRLIAGSY